MGTYAHSKAAAVGEAVAVALAAALSVAQLLQASHVQTEFHWISVNNLPDRGYRECGGAATWKIGEQGAWYSNSRMQALTSPFVPAASRACDCSQNTWERCFAHQCLLPVEPFIQLTPLPATLCSHKQPSYTTDSAKVLTLGKSGQ